MHLKYSSKFQLKPTVWVFVPTIQSIDNGKKLKLAIEKRWKAPKIYYHLKQGGHLDALRTHLHNSHFIHLDIQNFFGSINKTRVTRCLKELFPYSIAREAANFSTVLHPIDKKFILPFGFVQSPIVSSLCLDKSALGSYLRTLAKNTSVTVSVYVDDIIVSSNDEQMLSEIMSNIKSCACRAGFVLNDEKEEGPSIKITAFNIELANQSIEITANRIKDFEEAYNEALSQNVKKGIYGYIESVNPSQTINFS